MDDTVCFKLMLNTLTCKYKSVHDKTSDKANETAGSNSSRVNVQTALSA